MSSPYQSIAVLGSSGNEAAIAEAIGQHSNLPDSLRTSVATEAKGDDASSCFRFVIGLDAVFTTVGDLHFPWQDGVSTAQEAADDLVDQLTQRASITYQSTRGGDKGRSFLDAVREGLATDGGLFMPTSIPKLPPSVVHALSSDCVAQTAEAVPGDVSAYIGHALLVFERMIPRTEINAANLLTVLKRAYNPTLWPRAAKTTCAVREITSDDCDTRVFLSEQFHGPTAAFKDFALQVFPQLFALAIEAQNAKTGGAEEGEKYMILAATSGDTGVAAIRGFMNGAPNVKVLVLYPATGVSPVQKQQMLACEGGNVRVIGVEKDFDFCQATVKHIFNDKKTNDRLLQETKTRLSSANSINWGRLLPQIVYYFASYGHLVSRGVIKRGDNVDFAVPTGNFGNILACYIASTMGLPVGKFVLASNCNDVLFEFCSTGRYDISNRTLAVTASPSIDILKASNIERFIYLLSGGDCNFVASCMKGLEDPSKKFFEVPGDVNTADSMKGRLLRLFFTASCSEEQCSQTIRNYFTAGRTHCVLLDPHTAVGVNVAERFISCVPKEMRAAAVVVASTAHWSKFPAPVYEAVAPEAAPKQTIAQQNAESATAVDATLNKLKALVLERSTNKDDRVAVPIRHCFDVSAEKPFDVRTSVADMGLLEDAVIAFAAENGSQ